MRDRTKPSQAPFAFRVKTMEMNSETDPETVYDLTLPHCSCPDFRYNATQRKDPVCKHLRKAAQAGLFAWLDPFGEGINDKAAS